jgi:hypothetical protein
MIRGGGFDMVRAAPAGCVLPGIEPDTSRNRYLQAAYQVGMLALDALGKRNRDDDRNYQKFAQNPPYGDDVEWLFRIAKNLGGYYMYPFIDLAAQCVYSPFVLYKLFKETSKICSRESASFSTALVEIYIHPLLQKCLSLFYVAAQAKLSHSRFTPSDFEDLVTLVVAAESAFNEHPNGTESFHVFLQSLRKQKACKKEVWNRLLNVVHRQGQRPHRGYE